eukprot:8656502-Pyramimonas_sp.AAC.1
MVGDPFIVDAILGSFQGQAQRRSAVMQMRSGTSSLRGAPPDEDLTRTARCSLQSDAACLRCRPSCRRQMMRWTQPWRLRR